MGVNWFIYNFQLKFPLRLRRHFQIYWIHSWYVQICHQFCRTTGNSKRVSSPETNQALHCTTRNAQAAACPGLICQNGIQTCDGAKRGSEEVDVVHVSSNVDSMARNLHLLSRREYMKEGMAIQYRNDVMFRCLLVCWCRSLFVFPWAETGTLTYQQSLVHVYGGISHQRVSSLCVSDSELSAETKNILQMLWSLAGAWVWLTSQDWSISLKLLLCRQVFFFRWWICCNSFNQWVAIICSLSTCKQAVWLFLRIKKALAQ